MGSVERRAILRAYIASLPGGRGEFRRRSKLTKGRVTQLLDDREPFGERAAVSLALRLNLEPDYFNRPRTDDQIMPSSLPAESLAHLVNLWERLTPNQRQPIMELIQSEAAKNIDIAEHLHRITRHKLPLDGTIYKLYGTVQTQQAQTLLNTDATQPPQAVPSAEDAMEAEVQRRVREKLLSYAASIGALSDEEQPGGNGRLNEKSGSHNEAPETSPRGGHHTAHGKRKA